MHIEWSLPLFTLLAGSGSALLVFTGLNEFLNPNKKVRLYAAIAAIALLIIGGIASVFHLGNPANFMAAATMMFSGSPISMELLFLGIGVIVGVVYMILSNREGISVKVIGVVAIVVGVLFAYFSGHGYEVIAVKPAWATPALSFSYTFSALTMGGFLFLAIQAVAKAEVESIKKMGLIALVAAALSTIAFIVYGVMAPLGDQTILFWVVVVVIGGLVSIAAGFLVFSKGNIAMIYIGLIASVIGGIVFRVLMWLVGASYIPDLFEMALNRWTF